jgi:hypothetical protein
MSCLDSFLSFCQSIPLRYLEENTWGILVLAREDGTHDVKKVTFIAEKKLRGFISANSIPFPIIIDHNRVFHALASEGTALIVIDAAGRNVVKYSFPLGRADLNNIHQFFLKK